ncbi:carbohydrate kinase family protein [Nocardia pseudovaccinii]|uniref:carbohydrate kinase family protein n=1 Tax=Nocardia pseudovaccinii TaxID=189540 RepID=UPI003D91CDCA
MSTTEALAGLGLIAVAGEALVDLVPADAPDRFQAVPGGSPANVAVGLARLGVPVRMLARLGGDPLGHRIRNHLRDNAVALDHVVNATEPTSLAIVDVDPDGMVHYDFRVDGTADWQWTDSELSTALDGSVLALHTGSLALTVPPGADALTRLVDRARSTATISYDPNFRPQLMIRANTVDRVHAMLTRADIVKASAEDLSWLHPGRSPEEVVADWSARGPALVIVTLGPDGALAATGADATPIHRPGRPVDVIDTVGAGDAFTAAILAGLRTHHLLGAANREALRAIPKHDLTAILDEANLVAALTCGRRGADPPTAAELVTGR